LPERGINLLLESEDIRHQDIGIYCTNLMAQGGDEPCRIAVDPHR